MRAMPVILQTRLRGFSRAKLCRDVNAALGRLGLSRAELSLCVIGRRAMISANRRFFGRSSQTDVISISQLESAPRAPAIRKPPRQPEMWIGDVLVSLDAARRQSRERGHSLQTELSILAVHGLLHNLGMDDRTPAERAAMMARTRRVLRLPESVR